MKKTRRPNRYPGQTHLSCDNCGHRFSVRHNICPVCKSHSVCNYVPTQEEIHERSQAIKKANLAWTLTVHKHLYHNYVANPNGRGSIDLYQGSFE